MSNIFIFAAVLAAAFLLSKLKRKLMAAVLAAAFLLSKLKRKLMQMARDMAGK